MTPFDNGRKMSIIWRGGKRATWIRGQTKVEDVLTKPKKEWTWVSLTIRRTDNRWTTITEW